MELTVPLISLPAIVALLLKVGVYAYIRLFSVIYNLPARLFLYVLVALTVQNAAEVAGFYALNVSNTSPFIPGKIYFAAAIMAVAFLFHLSAHLAIDAEKRFYKTAVSGVYWIAGLLEILLVFTPWLVRDFEAFDYYIGRTMTRVPGPMHALFEFYVIGILLSVIALSTYGSQHISAKQTQNSIFLIAVIPIVAVAVLVVSLLHFGFRWINSTVTLPIAISYFLIVMTYAIHNRRFLDSNSEFSLRARQQLTEAQQRYTAQDSGADSDVISKKSFEEQMSELEMRLIREALQRSSGNKANAARMLGLRPNTLHYKMKRYGLS